MNGFSVRRLEAPDVEIDNLSEEEVARLVAKARTEGRRRPSQTLTADQKFRAAWFEDFRTQFKRALEEARFAGKLQALGV